MKYAYVACDQSGSEVADVNEASERIRRQGMYILRIEAATKAVGLDGRGRGALDASIMSPCSHGSCTCLPRRGPEWSKPLTLFKSKFKTTIGAKC